MVHKSLHWNDRYKGIDWKMAKQKQQKFLQRPPDWKAHILINTPEWLIQNSSSYILFGTIDRDARVRQQLENSPHQSWTENVLVVNLASSPLHYHAPWLMLHLIRVLSERLDNGKGQGKVEENSMSDLNPEPTVCNAWILTTTPRWFIICLFSRMLFIETTGTKV